MFFGRLVRVCTSVDFSDNDYALKIYSQLTYQNDKFSIFYDREALQRLLNQPHIIQMNVEHPSSIRIDNSTYPVLSTELLPVLFMSNLLSKASPFSDIITRTYFGQLLFALSACHEVGVYHRNLKLENLLFDKFFQLKLANFEHCFVRQIDDLETTEPYILKTNRPFNSIIPEFLDDSILQYKGSKADIWLAGCILFTMLTGLCPFDSISHDDKDLNEYFRLVLEDDMDSFWEMHHQFNGIVVSPSAKGKIEINEETTLNILLSYFYLNILYYRFTQ